MIIKNASFLISSSKAHQCPKLTKPEFAFIGRSNVGKSSLINMLCQRKSLAKTSSTPGKTQLINHFNIDDQWYLVDLPGYGYAKVSKVKRSGFSKLITNYLETRENMMCLFVLIDLRHKPQELDLKFMRTMGEAGIPFCIVFTKADKISPQEKKKNIENYNSTLLEEWEELPKTFITSSTKKEGREELLNYIEEISREWE